MIYLKFSATGKITGFSTENLLGAIQVVIP
jgi:hypothetical protein